MKALRAANVQPVLLPASVYNLGSTHYPAAREMIALGLPVVLATDFNPGSSPTASMPMVLSLACTHMKMTPAEAITAATINAAYSLRPRRAKSVRWNPANSPISRFTIATITGNFLISSAANRREAFT